MESLSIGAGLAQTSLDMRPEPQKRFSYPALGREFSDSEIKAELENCKLICSFLPCNETLVESACKAIAAGSLVGWFQGRCEFGHRALGFRSIVANPFAPYIDENINRFLKHRESFHPFVISLPEEAAGEYFQHVGPNARTIASLYEVKDAKRELLSKFTVQNVYVRVHTVRASDNSLFWSLLRRMESFTGHPMLINTSFNLPGEPLVLTPRDAIRSFYASGLDLLAMGRFLVTK
jgi:carbamoyltransferase